MVKLSLEIPKVLKYETTPNKVKYKAKPNIYQHETDNIRSFICRDFVYIAAKPADPHHPANSRTILFSQHLQTN